jgi:hypothetical protein
MDMNLGTSAHSLSEPSHEESHILYSEKSIDDVDHVVMEATTIPSFWIHPASMKPQLLK